VVRQLRSRSAVAEPPVSRRPAPGSRGTRRPAGDEGYDEPADTAEDRVVRRPGRAISRRQAVEEEPPARRSRRDADEPLSSRPGRSRPRPVDDDAYDDPDERPSRRGERGGGREREREERPQVDTSGGWDKWRSEKSKNGGFPDSFKPEEKTTYLIKFLQKAPFSTFGQHWVNEITEGKRSFICLDQDCPLCDDFGHRARAMALFNIVLFEEKQHGRDYVMEPVLRVWEAGPQIANEIAAVADDLEARGLDLNDVYVTVRRTSTGSGKSKKTHWAIKDIKERDVVDDWKMDPLSDEELDDFESKMFDNTMVKPQTRRELMDVVDALLGGAD